MSDIVDRLLDQELELLGRITVMSEEITRLRAALREIKKKLFAQSCTCSFVVDDIITRAKVSSSPLTQEPRE